MSPDAVEAKRPGEGWIVVPDGSTLEYPRTITLPVGGFHGFQGVDALQRPLRYTLKGQEVLVDSEVASSPASAEKKEE